MKLLARLGSPSELKISPPTSCAYLFDPHSSVSSNIGCIRIEQKLSLPFLFINSMFITHPQPTIFLPAAVESLYGLDCKDLKLDLIVYTPKPASYIRLKPVDEGLVPLNIPVELLRKNIQESKLPLAINMIMFVEVCYKTIILQVDDICGPEDANLYLSSEETDVQLTLSKSVMSSDFDRVIGSIYDEDTTKFVLLCRTMRIYLEAEQEMKTFVGIVLSNDPSVFHVYQSKVCGELKLKEAVEIDLSFLAHDDEIDVEQSIIDKWVDYIFIICKFSIFLHFN